MGGTSSVTVGQLAASARELMHAVDGRVMLGITGPPGSGKSTVAAAIVEAIGTRYAAILPMDGFHLTRAQIAGTPLWERRGAPDTFDSAAFADAVHRVRRSSGSSVAVPAFDHGVGDPVADAITVAGGIRLVVVEGNYLLHRGAAWRRARSELDAIWYIDADAPVRVARLEARHRALGRSAQDAARFVAESDEPNAALIATTAHHADVRYLVIEDHR